jgi:ATP-dependent DNA helicase RecG
MSFKEGERIELKKSLASLKEGLISISAILNKHGAGELWFGVAPSGKPVGLEINDKTLRDISQSIAAHIEPRIYPQITTENLHDKSCVKIVFTGKERPYFAYGRAYMRVADEDRHLTAKELETLILARNREALRWDNEPCKASLKDLSERKMKAFVKRAGLAWDNASKCIGKTGPYAGWAVVQRRSSLFRQSPDATIALRRLCINGYRYYY